MTGSVSICIANTASTLIGVYFLFTDPTGGVFPGQTIFQFGGC